MNKKSLVANALGQKKAGSKFTQIIMDNLVWFMLILFIIVMGIMNPNFFSGSILMNVIIQASSLAVLAAAVSFTLVIGQIDLSATGNMAVSTLIGVTMMTDGVPWLICVLVTLAVSSLIGFINGILVAKVKAVALMETLALNIGSQGLDDLSYKGSCSKGF